MRYHKVAYKEWLGRVHDLKRTPNGHAAIAVSVVGGYLQLVEWVDLFPWNDVRNGNGQETVDLILAGVTVLLVLFLWYGGKFAAITSSLGMAIWTWLQVSTWWIPYFRGAPPGWKRVYERWFSETVQVLPRTEANLPPDANHLVLHILILAAFVMSVRAAFAHDRKE